MSIHYELSTNSKALNENSSQAILNESYEKLKLKRIDHSNKIVLGFESYLCNKFLTDVTLKCNNNQTIRAHRIILSIFSPYFRSIFETIPSNQYPVIAFKDLDINDLQIIIDFIYKGQVSVSRFQLQSVIQAAQVLEVSDLVDLKMEIFDNELKNSSLFKQPFKLDQFQRQIAEENFDLGKRTEKQIHLEKLQFQNTPKFTETLEKNQNIPEFVKSNTSLKNLRWVSEFGVITEQVEKKSRNKDKFDKVDLLSNSQNVDSTINDDNQMFVEQLSIIGENFSKDSDVAFKLSKGISSQIDLNLTCDQLQQKPSSLALFRGPGRPPKDKKSSKINSCPECHKEFVRPDVLKLHYRSMHLKERYPCDLCEKIFKWPGDLKTHKRKSCKRNKKLL